MKLGLLGQQKGTAFTTIIQQESRRTHDSCQRGSPGADPGGGGINIGTAKVLFIINPENHPQKEG